MYTFKTIIQDIYEYMCYICVFVYIYIWHCSLSFHMKHSEYEFVALEGFMIFVVLSLGANGFQNLSAHSIYESYRLVQTLFLKEIRLQLVKNRVPLNVVKNNQENWNSISLWLVVSLPDTRDLTDLMEISKGRTKNNFVIGGNVDSRVIKSLQQPCEEGGIIVSFYR